MKAYFNRNVPFYILSHKEINDSNGFDAYPVDVPDYIVVFAQQARSIINKMTAEFENSSAPEEAAQSSAIRFMQLIDGMNDGEE